MKPNSVEPIHVAVLAGETSWHFQDLARASQELNLTKQANIKLAAGSFEQIAGGLVSNLPSFSCEPGSYWKPDVVFVRTMPFGTLEQIVFRMDLLQRLMLAGTPVINSPKTIEASVDKYLCLAKLAAAEIPVPNTQVSQTLDQAIADFKLLGGDVVVKPIFGSMGRGIERLTDLDQAKDSFVRLIQQGSCLLYTSPSPRDQRGSRMPSSA